MKNYLRISYGNEKRWVNYRIIIRDGEKRKVPYTAAGKLASTTDPETWSTYDVAIKSSSDIGIVFTPEQTLLGIDIDHCLTGNEITHEKREIIAQFIADADTYTEISPSGTGLHSFLKLTEPITLEANKKAPFELYTKGRYFTVTNNPYKEARPVRVVTSKEALKLISILGYPWGRDNQKHTQQPTHSPVDDAEIIERIFTSKNGAKIRVLYNGDITGYNGDDSAADMALCSHLAFCTEKNIEQMERIWLASPLGARNKTQERKDYREKTISAAILGCKEVYKEKKSHASSAKENGESDDKKSQAKNILEIIKSKENTILFHDERGNNYISLEVAGHREIWGCKSKSIKGWITSEFWKRTHTVLNSESLKNVLETLGGIAAHEGLEYKLNDRFAWDGDSLWYDLANDKWQAVRINEHGWKIIDSPPILFKRYYHSRPQVVPIEIGGNVNLLLNYVNIADSQDRLLLLVYLISCFIPDFAHVILVIFGSRGSAKTTLSKLLRLILDPSVLEVVSLPDNVNELVQILAHHAFLFFDNVSHISEGVSDTMCKAVTGSGFSKRELYTDDEDIIYKLKRCIGINGINLVGTRPDLLERSLLLELDRIEPENRKQEKDLMDSFDRDLPIIFGGVLDILVKAIKIKPTIKITNLPRMADFAVWGCAIAEAMGYQAQDFLNAYRANIGKQTQVILNENIVATAIFSFMEDRNEEWRGTATNLLRELTDHAAFQNINTYEKYWPKASNALTRRLNELKISLKEAGIIYTCSDGNIREVLLRKVKEKVDTDDTDDKTPNF